MATTTADHAALRSWDCVVIGAGPAGAMAALELARRDRRVLLVDHARFPRDKVCGGCINRAAIDQLKQAGCGDLPRALGAPRTSALELVAAGQAVTLALSSGRAVSRAAFDAALVGMAIDHGAAFLDGHAATMGAVVDDQRHVLLRGDGEHLVRAQLVIVATGLRTATWDDAPAVTIRRSSLMGVSATLDAQACGDAAPRSGVIRMACAGRRGYVGSAVLEHGRINFAAAVAPSFVRSMPSVGSAVSQLLTDAGVSAPGALVDTDWRGTPQLTRSRRLLGGERVLVIGDAAGYVEPFTGEGIAWALGSGRGVAPVADAAIDQWSPQFIGQWTRISRGMFAGRRRACFALTRLLRSRTVMCGVIRLLRLAPQLASPFIDAIESPFSPPPTGKSKAAPT